MCLSFPFPTNPIEAGKGKLISFISLEAGAGVNTLSIMTALTTCWFTRQSSPY